MIAKRPSFTHERAGRMLAGGSALACLALGWLASPWFLLGAAGTALNLVVSAITDRCLVKSLLIALGLPGERDLGRAEALAASASARVDRPPAPTQLPPVRAEAADGRGRRLADRLGVTIN